ncbi:low molecular weight protein-tyrosine-phosphatase [Aestuariirhabdus litorea]|uniref:protein-tyrosine-phosphatase n=1 Tax=Aestuariirhabdus litorea TaxID=2528527 RepID=A0A3P3VSL9_9GAMM|nr:low molecular weight protein-tyrosine-phosphatase [Aestuariirhabdus litorea]RRJ84686.1 low molecular weight phosphotyrosine protein phosphatase [Aestuariirhabdus litorea]RWW97911.1 low molecular weight phosphotyrosine protein phosphatase [Endozoicomonadaceae bacterium GTF-13]
MVRILFVCLGNICRSPTAHGVFQGLVDKHGLGDRFEVESAGTSAYHVGNSPDHRSTAAAAARGYDLSELRAQQVVEADFSHYDLVLAMDGENLRNLTRLCPPQHLHKVQLFLDYGSKGVKEVPDPYYGGTNGFNEVLDLVEDAARGLFEQLRSTQ